jgi:3'(2'), 5'-bisphosphate nucleotidase
MNTIEQLIPIIRHAGSILLEYRNSGYETNTKSSADDFVTTADLKADEYLRLEISKLFPRDKILSEENSSRPEDYTGRVWMIDPLDGTRAFVDGHESFSVMIGLAVDGVPVLGVTYAPVCNKLYYAETGAGAYLVEEGLTTQIHVSDVTDIKNAGLVGYRRTTKIREWDSAVDKLGLNVVAAEGTNTLKIGRVAQGLADVVISTNSGVCKWDFCAPQIILEEAGGSVSDLEGKSIDYLSPKVELDKSFVASNGHIHQAILNALTQD